MGRPADATMGLPMSTLSWVGMPEPDPGFARFRAPGGDSASDHVSEHTGRFGVVRVLGQKRQAERDRSQLVELYHAHRLRLTRLAVLLVDDVSTAEDVVQDVFVELHRRWDSMPDIDNAAGYLRVAVVNRARSALRRRKTARDYVPPISREHDATSESVVLADEHREVLDALAKLPRRQREVLVLRYWSDLTEAEIAESLGISKGTVKSTASRALDALEKVLEAKR